MPKTNERGATLDARGYPIEVHQEEDGSFTVLVPDLPGCVAAGDNMVDAIALIGDAIDAWLDAAQAEGRGIPAPSSAPGEYSGRFLVRLPRTIHRAAARQAAREGVSLNTYCVTAITGAVTRGLATAQTAQISQVRFYDVFMDAGHVIQMKYPVSGVDWRTASTAGEVQMAHPMLTAGVLEKGLPA